MVINFNLMHFINFGAFDICIKFTTFGIRISLNFSNSSNEKSYLKKKKKSSKKSVEKCPSASRAAEEVTEAY